MDSDDQVASKKHKSKKTTKSVASKKGKDTPLEKVDKTCKNKSETKTKSASSATPSCSNVNTSNFNLTKLSQSDNDNLRSLMGIETVQNKANDNFEHFGVQELYGNSLHKLPTMRVEIDSADISWGESPLHGVPSNITAHNDMTSALFEEGEIVDENEWDLPRL